MKKLILVTFFLIVYACGGGGGGLFAKPLTVRWDHSGLDIDGNLETLDYFVVSWGTASGVYPNVLMVTIFEANCESNATYPFYRCSALLMADAPPDTYYAVTRAVDVAGNVSGNSNEASKVIVTPDTVQASEPQNASFD